VAVFRRRGNVGQARRYMAVRVNMVVIIR